MSQASSFILNSNRSFWRQAKPIIFLIFWTFVGLVAIDVSINILFAYPQDPKFMNPSRFQSYFEYGRSIEGKLSRMTRKNPDETAPITLSGWYDPLIIKDFSKSNTSAVTFYGASHTVNLANALGRTSNQLSPRIVGGPGATTNWAYGAYLRDQGSRKSRAVVLGFTSLNFAMISSYSPMLWYPDFPMPYTADRFYLEGGQLKVAHPPYTSFDQYVKTFYNPVAWAAALEFFATHDPFYDSFVMRANILDHSSLWRLFRRAYSQKLIRELQKSSLDKSGFRSDSEQVRIAHAIIHAFAVQARGDGIIPVIYIVNDLGYSDYLFRALRPALDADHVRYLNSAAIISPYDSRGYLPDGHFTIEEDDRLATALAEIIKYGR